VTRRRGWVSGEPALSVEAVAADDRLLAAVVAGEGTGGDPLHELLGSWRTELDLFAADAGRALGAPIAISPRAAGWRRRALLGTAAVAAALSVTTAAAAVTGPSGLLAPLHRVLFGAGHPVPSDAGRIRQAAGWVDAAQHVVDHARVAGGISPAMRRAAAAQLDAAAGLLRSDASRNAQALDLRIGSVRRELGDLPALPVGTAAPTPVVTHPTTEESPTAPAGTETTSPEPSPGENSPEPAGSAAPAEGSDTSGPSPSESPAADHAQASPTPSDGTGSPEASSSPDSGSGG